MSASSPSGSTKGAHGSAAAQLPTQARPGSAVASRAHVVATGHHASRPAAAGSLGTFQSSPQQANGSLWRPGAAVSAAGKGYLVGTGDDGFIAPLNPAGGSRGAAGSSGPAGSIAAAMGGMETSVLEMQLNGPSECL